MLFTVKYVPVILAEKEQWRIIRQCHEGYFNSIQVHAMSGHFGRDKTCSLISAKVFFPNRKQKVSKFVFTCEPCQCVKAGTKFNKGEGKLQSIPVPRECWQQIGTDLITNLPVTEEGYNTLVTAVDCTSKWVESKSLKR